MIEMNRFYNCDNMEYMATVPDKYFELAIVDPPYGLDEKLKGGKNGSIQFNDAVDRGWDKVPTEKYFNELFRISKNQIICGGNYFNLPPTRCFIVWDKLNAEDFSLAMCELLWTSFDKLAKIYRLSNRQGNKIHPTQKPVALYRWILQNYAKKGDKIFDSHVGSGSSIIACIEEGFEYVGCELDKDYYKSASNRIEIFKSQGKLF